MMKKLTALIIFIFILQYSVFSQGKNISLETSSSVDKMMEKFIRNGKSIDKIRAWRIQIITTDDRRAMEQALSSFKSLYPGISAEWKHVSPYYQIRVGYYETKNKLMPFLLELKKTYPSATPVYDSMSKRALVYN